MNIKMKFKKSPKCPICGSKNTFYLWYAENYQRRADDYDVLDDVYWFGDTKYSYYLCYNCGFLEKTTDRTHDTKIVIDPKVIPLERQLKALRQHYKKLSGQRIGTYDNNSIKMLKLDPSPWNFAPDDSME